MSLGTIFSTTESRAANVASIRAAIASIPNFGEMTAAEQTKALKGVRKEHGARHTTAFFLKGETGIKVKIPKGTAMLLQDLREVEHAD